MKRPTAEAEQVRAVTLTSESGRWVRVGVVAGVLVLLVVFSAVYYVRTYDGLTDRHALDAGQVARNIAQGHGFTTSFIRPVNEKAYAPLTSFPELNQGPAYPYAVSLLIRLRGASDQVVIWTSLVFLCLTIGATYFLGRLLFGWRAGLLAAAVVGISRPVLDIAVSGSRWTMAAWVFTLALLAIAIHHKAAERDQRRLTHVAAAVGGMLSAGLYYIEPVTFFLLIPMAVYFAATGCARRSEMLLFLGVAVAFTAPWLYRNTQLTGSPILGGNTWDILANTGAYPGDVIYRRVADDALSMRRAVLFAVDHFGSFAGKLITGSAETGSALLAMVGIPAAAFAAVSVLYRFKESTACALRGVCYALLPTFAILFGLFGGGPGAAAMLGPVIAVFASAYFLRLVDSKKLHPFYSNALVGGLVLLTAFPTISSVGWPSRLGQMEKAQAAHRFFAWLGEKGYRELTYSDAPWIAAWRTQNRAVWVPTSDEDVYRLEQQGLDMRFIVLTPESEKLSPEEIWHVLHTIRAWRDYLEDPEKGLRSILDQSAASLDQAKGAKDYMRRLKRNYAVSETISGARSYDLGPLQADYVQIIELPRQAE